MLLQCYSIVGANYISDCPFVTVYRSNSEVMLILILFHVIGTFLWQRSNLVDQQRSHNIQAMFCVHFGIVENYVILQ